MTRLLTTAATLALLSACTPMAQFTVLLPDDRILVNLKVEEEAAKAEGEREWSEAYLLTAQATRDVNALIGGVLLLARGVSSTAPSERSDTHAVWGPYAGPLDPVETRMQADYDPGSDTYTWFFEQKPKGGDDSAYLPVVEGEVDAAAVQGDHSGRFWIDFATMTELDPNVRGDGLFLSDYEVNPEDVAATATFDSFRDGDEEAVDASYGYRQTVEGEGEMDLGWLADADGQGAEEAWSVHSRWTWEGAGRGDVRLSGGDLAQDATLNECWDTAFAPVYRLESWSGLEEGEVGLCSFADADYGG